MSDVVSPLDDILRRARWAPSGDNRQSFRFTIVAADHLVIHGFDTRQDCVYDLDGTSSQIALGALIETMAIVASTHGLGIACARREDSPDDAPVIDVRLVPDPSAQTDPLANHVESRSVNRRPLRTRPLATAERAALEAAIGVHHRIIWREGGHARRRLAGLLFRSAHLRLTMYEAYLVHRAAIEWGAQFSDDRVPDAAVGLDRMTLRLMRWAMGSWDRVRFLNRFLAGTWIPRVQLDLLPAMLCAGHFLLVSRRDASSIDDFIAAGRALQRFWLTATSLGLQLQPELTPLIFARYFRTGRRFSDDPTRTLDAGRIARSLDAEFGPDATEKAVFLGRVGAGRSATARSLRLPVDRLMLKPGANG